MVLTTLIVLALSEVIAVVVCCWSENWYEACALLKFYLNSQKRVYMELKWYINYISGHYMYGVEFRSTFLKSPSFI